MKQIRVFEGRELQSTVPAKQPRDFRCALPGKDFSGQRSMITLDESFFSKHLMFLGGIGTGKSNTMYQVVKQIKQTLTPQDVMIIFDTKGDFLAEFGESKDIVISNDEHARGKNGESDYWNLFNEIETGDRLEENITEIAKTLFYEKIQSSNQPFFPNAAKDIFAGILTFFCRAGEEMNNKALRSFFDSCGVDVIREALKKQDDMAGIASYIEGEDSRQSQGIISELQQLIREIFIGNFRKNGSLSMRQLVREKQGRTIFIEYDLGIGNMLTPIYRLLFDMAIKEALSRGKSEGNVWLIADEFRLIPHLQHVDNAVNFGRSLGVKMMIGVQNVEQLFEVYGQERARSILSGFSSSFTFRLNDSASREFIKSLFGENRKMDTYSSSLGTKAITEIINRAHVVEDWDIDRLDIGQAVVGLTGNEPFIFQFDEYMRTR